MRKKIFIIVLMLFLAGCGKEEKPQKSEEIQKKSNIIEKCIGIDGGSFMLKFNTDGGNNINDINVCIACSPDTYDSMPTPKKNNAIFEAWYYDKELTNKVDAKSTLDIQPIPEVNDDGCLIGYKDITLYAKWKENKKEKVPTEEENNKTNSAKNQNNSIVKDVTYIDGIMIVNKSYGLPSSYVPSNLVSCGNSKVIDNVCNSFNEMKNAAAKDGVNIYLQSGYRSYDTQKSLYDKYVARSGKKEADTYSARPGYSEHQTGLAFDVCSKETTECINSGFDSSNAAKWLSNNASKYGFVLRYPKGKESITGYKYESWHFRYVGTAIANKLYKDGSWITLEEFFDVDSKYAD